jgi:hypothetical protein
MATEADWPPSSFQSPLRGWRFPDFAALAAATAPVFENAGSEGEKARGDHQRRIARTANRLTLRPQGNSGQSTSSSSNHEDAIHDH